VHFAGQAAVPWDHALAGFFERVDAHAEGGCFLGCESLVASGAMHASRERSTTGSGQGRPDFLAHEEFAAKLRGWRLIAWFGFVHGPFLFLTASVTESMHENAWTVVGALGAALLVPFTLVQLAVIFWNGWTSRTLYLMGAFAFACIASLFTAMHLTLTPPEFIVPWISIVLFGYAFVRGVFIPEGWTEAALGHMITVASAAVSWLLTVSVVGDRVPWPDDPGLAVSMAVMLSMPSLAIVMSIAATHSRWQALRAALESETLGRYSLVRQIGHGGMGQIWLATDKSLGRPVALKLLRQDAANENSVARFEREAEATSMLRHPNTVRVLDFGVGAAGDIYYTMELLEGRDLAEEVRQVGPLPVPRAMHFIRQAASALAEAHRAGLVHRDIKPANLFVTNDGFERDFLKVVDFGIARVLEAPTETSLTAQGTILGSPEYLSPEAALMEEVGPPGDVYALGATLFFMLTGRPPFEHENVLALIAAHAFEAPPPLATLVSEPVPEALDAIIARCLRKDPSERYADASALFDALLDVDVPAWKAPRIAESFERHVPSRASFVQAETVEVSGSDAENDDVRRDFMSSGSKGSE
jgi:serine/threonine protein kinase